MDVRVAARLTRWEDAMFGHTFELIIVLLVGLLIFGPKRVIEMGAAAGKMLRELRDAMKDMNWGSLTGSDEHGSDPLADLRELRDLPRTFASSILNPPPVSTPSASAPTPAPPDVTTPAAEIPATPTPTVTPVVESEPPLSQNGSVPSNSVPGGSAPAE